jgi:glutamyl-tRNA reductase
VQVVAVGISHTTAPVGLRERLAVSADAVPGVLDELAQRVEEAFILSTCSRIEVYAVCGHESTGAELLRQFLSAQSGVEPHIIGDVSYACAHQSAVRHLLRVAAGLDSMILGEHEILGQVRRALGAARQAGTLGPVLDRLGDAALVCGKRVRSLTTLGSDRRSVASAALEIATRVRGGLDDADILVLGAGETAHRALSHLAALGNARITVMNRTHDRGATLAAAHGATARPWDELDHALGSADVVVGCTASRTPVLDAERLARARAGTTDRALLCLDLGAPRDIDPGVSAMPGVTLIDLDRIEQESAPRQTEHARELGHAESIVAHEVERYMEWWRGRGVASTVARLHARADAIRSAELERALARLPDLTPHARAVISDLATRIVGKLLHEPSVVLKRDAEGANMAVVVERLFALMEPDICGRDTEVSRQTIHQESKAS